MEGTAPTRRRVLLGPGREFDLIRAFLAREEALPDAVRVGPGDDCAVLDATPLAVSTDLSVEGVHFRRAWLSPEEVGWRAGAASLSDLAAVAAAPVAVLVSVALAPEDAASGWGLRLVAGVEEAARQVGAALVGGDLSRSPGPAVVDVVALGKAEAPVLRDGAAPGDEVWVTGELGAAGAALALLSGGRHPPDGLRRAFARPEPRVREARWLVENAGLHALIDLSDGLAGDVGHVAAASGVAVELDASAVPLAASSEGVGLPPEARLRLALSAGEDYELCLVAPPGALGPLDAPFRGRFGLALTRVGRVRKGEGVWLRIGAGPPHRLEGSGFDHFGGVAEGGSGKGGPG